jgi:hypothetical protein
MDTGMAFLLGHLVGDARDVLFCIAGLRKLHSISQVALSLLPLLGRDHPDSACPSEPDGLFNRRLITVLQPL